MKIVIPVGVVLVLLVIMWFWHGLGHVPTDKELWPDLTEEERRRWL